MITATSLFAALFGTEMRDIRWTTARLFNAARAHRSHRPRPGIAVFAGFCFLQKPITAQRSARTIGIITACFAVAIGQSECIASNDDDDS